MSDFLNEHFDLAQKHRAQNVLVEIEVSWPVWRVFETYCRADDVDRHQKSKILSDAILNACIQMDGDCAELVIDLLRSFIEHEVKKELEEQATKSKPTADR